MFISNAPLIYVQEDISWSMCHFPTQQNHYPALSYYCCFRQELHSIDSWIPIILKTIPYDSGHDNMLICMFSVLDTDPHSVLRGRAPKSRAPLLSRVSMMDGTIDSDHRKKNPWRETFQATYKPCKDIQSDLPRTFQ